MRKFKCSFYDNEVDLDDPNTYTHLPNNIKDLRNKMFCEIGYYYCYTQFLHKDIFDKEYNQNIRVSKLIKNFTENEKSNYDNILWYKEQLFLFMDEIENMC